MGHVITKTVSALFLPIALIHTGTHQLSASEYQTKHVFLVVIDGVRNDEAFDDSTHQFIPRIWNDLRPLGTICTEFYNTARTYTTSGHAIMVCGQRNNLMNADVTECDPYRPRIPTIFEYYRKHMGISKQKVWAILGKENLSSITASLYPGYGEGYSASLMHDTGPDTTTMELLHDTIESSHPSLVVLNLKDVDVTGHSGSWMLYTQAISRADSLVWDLWQMIESDPFYQGKTTMIVTTDHGRHDDQHGGFPDHGGTDHGSQHCMFLAVGPDIKQDTVITDRTDMTDIAPTIGELLGFDTPYADGRILSEIIITPSEADGMKRESHGSVLHGSLEQRLTFTNRSSVTPSLVKTLTNLHMVWSESDSTTISVKQRVLYSRRDDVSGEWTVPVSLFQDLDPLTVILEGELAPLDGEDVLVAARAMLEVFDDIGKATYRWFPLVTRTEGLDSWSQTTILSDFARGKRNIIASPVSIHSTDAEIDISWITSDRWFIIERSVDGGYSFSTVLDYIPKITDVGLYLFGPDIAKNDLGMISVVETNFFHHSRILFGSLSFLLEDFSSLTLLDPGKEASFYPHLLATPTKIHFTWADLSSGTSQIFYRNCLPDGSGMSEIQLLSQSPVGAGNPQMVSRGDTLIVVWEDHRHGNPEIYSAMSVDEGVHWFTPARLTMTEGISTNSSIAVDQDDLVVAWQDNTDGYWDIYLIEYPLSLLTEPAECR